MESVNSSFCNNENEVGNDNDCGDDNVKNGICNSGIENGNEGDWDTNDSHYSEEDEDDELTRKIKAIPILPRIPKLKKSENGENRNKLLEHKSVLHRKAHPNEQDNVLKWPSNDNITKYNPDTRTSKKFQDNSKKTSELSKNKNVLEPHTRNANFSKFKPPLPPKSNTNRLTMRAWQMDKKLSTEEKFDHMLKMEGGKSSVDDSTPDICSNNSFSSSTTSHNTPASKSKQFIKSKSNEGIPMKGCVNKGREGIKEQTTTKRGSETQSEFYCFEKDLYNSQPKQIYKTLEDRFKERLARAPVKDITPTHSNNTTTSHFDPSSKQSSFHQFSNLPGSSLKHPPSPHEPGGGEDGTVTHASTSNHHTNGLWSTNVNRGIFPSFKNTNYSNTTTTTNDININHTFNGSSDTNFNKNVDNNANKKNYNNNNNNNIASSTATTINNNVFGGGWSDYFKCTNSEKFSTAGHTTPCSSSTATHSNNNGTYSTNGDHLLKNNNNNNKDNNNNNNINNNATSNNNDDISSVFSNAQSSSTSSSSSLNKKPKDLSVIIFAHSTLNLSSQLL